MGRTPRQEEVDVIEKLRDALVPLMQQLSELQLLAGIVLPLSQSSQIPVDETEYDAIADEYLPNTADALGIFTPDTTSSQSLPIERQPITLPSNNAAAHQHRELEVTARIQHADEQLQRLRDLIADISFQYSHIIRAATHKPMRLRGHAKVRTLTHQLVHYARTYSRCRQCLLALDCSADIMCCYPALSKHDLRASTAILNPNIPGASNVQLSWLWYSGEHRSMAAAAGLSPEAANIGVADNAVLLECMSVHSFLLSQIYKCVFQSSGFTGYVPAHRCKGGRNN